MISNKHILKIFILLIFLGGHEAFPQNKKKTKGKQEKKDTLPKNKVNYKELSEKGNKKEGIFNVYKLKGKYYFEIDNSLFGKDFLLVSKISQVPYAINGHGLNKGMAFEKKLIRFYHDKDLKKVWVKTISPRVQSPDNNSITNSVRDNFIASVIEQFEVQSTDKDSTSVVIKVNKVFDGKEKSFFDLLNNIGLGGSVNTKLSKINQIKSFPKNVVVKSLITTSIKEGKSAKVSLSIGVTTNIVLLPEDVMQPRFSDNRIGYFSTPMDYYNDKQHEVEHRKLITRWRLEPKKEDVEKYLNGELVEPKKPIVYYLDPATPKQWLSYIKQGVLDWNKAFEKAGFKNAIIVKTPENDPDFDIDDVRYSVIVYTASSRQNAMGPSVVDPRSGEILEADIIWWHNLMKGLHAWLRVQTGVVDDNSRKNKFSNEHMGEAIRFVSSHEVGHTLGLKHNMGASFSYPVDSLRSPTFTKRMQGTAPSIMDYARFNYVAQPGDNVTELNPKIGIYDKYAINWGYRWLNTKNPHEEIATLRAIIRKHENDPMYFYGEQQRTIIDPRSQSEDLGDDAVKASEYGLLNLKRIVPNILEWTCEDGETYYKSAKLYKEVITQWNRYNYHVMANIGGLYLNNTVYGDHKKTYVPVPAEIQKRSLEYLIENAIKTQKWLFIPKFIDKVFAVKDAPNGERYYSPVYMVRSYQANILHNLLENDRLMRITENEVLVNSDDIFTQDYLFTRLFDTIFEKTLEGEDLDLFERLLQKNYVDVLMVSRNMLLQKVKKRGLSEDALHVNFSSIPRNSDACSKKEAELQKILKLVKRKKKKGDQATRNHYIDLISRIEYNLKN